MVADGSRDKTYRVTCEECGAVEFEVIDENRFANPTAATWYAGYHSGKEHPNSDAQEAFAEVAEE